MTNDRTIEAISDRIRAGVFEALDGDLDLTADDAGRVAGAVENLVARMLHEMWDEGPAPVIVTSYRIIYRPAGTVIGFAHAAGEEAARRQWANVRLYADVDPADLVFEPESTYLLDVPG